MRGLLISSAIIVIICQGFGLTGAETLYAWIAIGIVAFVIRAALDLCYKIGNALRREPGDTYNFNQNVTEEHKHGDPTRPGEEVYPAVMEIRRELTK